MKIPTYTAKGRPTAEVSSIKTGLKISPTSSMASALLPAAKEITDYVVKKRNIEETVQSKKKVIEIKSEYEKFLKEEENNIVEDDAIRNFSIKSNQYALSKINQIKNKRVKAKVITLLDLENAEYIYNVKKNSRDALEKENINIYNTEQNILAGKYSTTEDLGLKDNYEFQLINNAKIFNEQNNLGKTSLDKDIKNIKTDLFLFDVDKLVANKEYAKAEAKLKDVKNSTFFDNELRQEKLLKIEKEGLEYKATSYGVSQILQGKNPLIGPVIPGTTDKKILEGTDSYLLSIAEKNNLNEEQTFAFVDDKFAQTGLLSSAYEEVIQSGYTAGSATTFDSPADIPPILISAVKTAEIADKTGRLNVYTTQEQQLFFENIIVAKQILGMNDFQAIKSAKEFENNYDKAVLIGTSTQRDSTFAKVESFFTTAPWFSGNTKATNIGEVKGYANKIFNMYVVSGIDPKKAQDLTIENLKNNLELVDNYAYMKRDIDAFKSIGGLNMVKPVKEYIIKNQMTDEDSKEYFLRYNGGGVFEIRRKLDLAPVFNKNNQPMVFYAKDLYAINQEREAKGLSEIKQEVQKSQEEKIKAKKLHKEYFPSGGF